MKEERLMILKMVEDGKISADDAVKLMNSLNSTDGLKECDVEEKLRRVARNMDSFTKDLRDKISSMAKDVEPKFRSTTKAVIEKTSEVVDEFAKNLKDAVKSFDSYQEEDEEKKESDNFSDEDDDSPREN